MRRIWLFLALVVLFSGPFWYLARSVGYLYTTLLMWCPAAAALLARRLMPAPPRDLGLARFPWRAALTAYLLMAAILIALFAALYAAGIASFPDPTQLADRAGRAGMQGWPVPAFAIGFLLLTMTGGIVSLSANALGEEIGWRGFLVPELYRRFGFTGAALFSGLIWSAWHLPLLVGRASAVEMLNFIVGLTGLGFLYCWFRLRSNSTWPAVLIHGVHNALLEGYFLRLSLVATPADAIWLDETGYAMALAGLAVAAITWALVRRDTDGAFPAFAAQPSGPAAGGAAEAGDEAAGE